MSRAKLWSRRVAWLLALWAGSFTAFAALAYLLHVVVHRLM